MYRHAGSCAMAIATGARAIRLASARSRARNSSGVASAGGSNSVGELDIVRAKFAAAVVYRERLPPPWPLAIGAHEQRVEHLVVAVPGAVRPAGHFSVLWQRVQGHWRSRETMAGELLAAILRRDARRSSHAFAAEN